MGLWSEIKMDFYVPVKRDPALHGKCEIFFNYPGVWAVIWYRIANRLYKLNYKRFSRLISGVSSLITRVDIHPAATIGKELFIDHAFGVVIGETAIIRDHVTIYQGVTLGGVELSQTKRHPTLEDNVVIGAGAKILGNITIGKNAKVGANSVVIRDVGADCTAVGIPAHAIAKGRNKSPLSHNKLPDLNKELFTYMMQRLNVLENAVVSGNKKDIDKRDHELETRYEEFINSMQK
jgi:serine O-acetyltransferase